MARLAGNFHDEAACESDGWLLFERHRCGPDHLPVLQHQPIVLDRHSDSYGGPVRVQVVDGTQYPDCFGKHQARNPCAVRDKCLGTFNLSRIVPDDKPDENIGDNGTHASRINTPFHFGDAMMRSYYPAIWITESTERARLIAT